MASQRQPQLCNAFETLDEFFLHHSPPLAIRNAWVQLKIDLLISSPPQACALNEPSISVALDKVHEQLLLIEKSMSVSQNTAKPSSSYADAVKTPSLLPKSLKRNLGLVDFSMR
jgi:hypothetical protein